MTSEDVIPGGFTGFQGCSMQSSDLYWLFMVSKYLQILSCHTTRSCFLFLDLLNTVDAMFGCWQILRGLRILLECTLDIAVY